MECRIAVSTPSGAVEHDGPPIRARDGRIILIPSVDIVRPDKFWDRNE
jgi:hypothetical protein